MRVNNSHKQIIKNNEVFPVITSASNGQIKYINLLQKKSKARKEASAFVIEGENMFEESRREGNLIKAYFSETFYNNRSIEEPTYFKDLSFEIIQDGVFNKVSNTATPQGVLATAKMADYDISQIINNPKATLLVLENIQDPGNLGTMVRTAEAAGFTGIILSKDCVDMFNPKVIRSTMGAIYRMPFAYEDNSHDFKKTLQEIKSKNISIYAASLEGASCYDIIEYSNQCAVLIGNEANGLKKTTADMADTIIKIPMEGKVESLNAAVAAAIIMFEVARQRRL